MQQPGLTCGATPAGGCPEGWRPGSLGIHREQREERPQMWLGLFADRSAVAMHTIALVLRSPSCPRPPWRRRGRPPGPPLPARRRPMLLSDSSSPRRRRRRRQHGCLAPIPAISFRETTWPLCAHNGSGPSLGSDAWSRSEGGFCAAKGGRREASVIGRSSTQPTPFRRDALRRRRARANARPLQRRGVALCGHDTGRRTAAVMVWGTVSGLAPLGASAQPGRSGATRRL